MTGKLLSRINELVQKGALLYRTKRGKTILQKFYVVFYVSLILLSILMVMTFPYPIKPKTSVGMINFIVAILGIISLPQIIKEIKNNSGRFGTPVDILVMFFYLSNLLSLLFAERIQDFTPIRMVTSAVATYFFIKVYVPNEKTRIMLVHAMGIITIGIAVLSVLQAMLPNLMNAIATIFFQGREAYGLAIEHGRGRIAPWGSIILLFPFFYSSLYLGRKKPSYFYITYALGGLIVLLLAMTLSNFRWTFLVFLLVSALYIKILRTSGYLSKQYIFRAVLLGGVVLAIGLVGARLTLGYNLVDRFLLTNNTRDVSDTLGRLLLYSQAVNVFSSSPIVGAGVGNYYSLVGAFQVNRYFSIFDQIQIFLVPIASHNEFLTVLAETGILGFVSYFLIMYFTLKKVVTYLLSISNLTEINQLWVVTCFLSLLSFLLYTLFENIYPENIVYIFMLIGIIHTWFLPSSVVQKS